MENPSKNWMQSHRHAFGDRPISNLCIPASHNSGMYRASSHHSRFGTEGNILTQTKSIFDQLELGVRRLDIRPVIATAPYAKDEDIACGNYIKETEDAISWEGGNGVALREVINDLNRFTKNNAELIFVDIAHFYHMEVQTGASSKWLHTVPRQWEMLLNALSSIDNLFTVARAGAREKPFQDYHLNQFIGNNQAAVVVLIDGHDNPGSLFQHGFWPSNLDCGSDHLNLNETSVTRMPRSGDAIYSTLNPIRFGGPESNPKSLLSLANEVQEEVLPILLQKFATDGYPSSIAMDRVDNSDLFTICLATSYQRFNLAGLHNTVIVYGGRVVIDDDIHKIMRDHINNSTSIVVNNKNLGLDPWKYMVKSCAIFYEHAGLMKGRFAKEGKPLHFEYDIVSIKYGNTFITKQDVYLRMLACLYKKQPFKVHNDNLGGDPQRNVVKTCSVGFRLENDRDISQVEAKEGESLHFEQDIISIKYGNTFVTKQDVYLRMLECLHKKQPFKVNNDNLGGDPQRNVVKTCSVRFRRENDRDIRQVEAKEGASLNFY